MAALPGPRAGTAVSAARSGSTVSDSTRTNAARIMRIGASFMPSNPLHLLQLLGHERVHEFFHVSAEHRDLAYQRGRNEGELFLRREKHRFQVAHEMSRHVGQLELELEIGNRAQAAHHD